MHFTKNLALFIGAVAGFTIPQGQPDGVYAVSSDAKGVDVHTFLSAPVNSTEALSISATAAKFPRRGLAARQTQEIGCQHYELNHVNTDEAVEALKRQCGPGAINSGYNFYSISGSTVAYICNMGHTAVICESNGVGEVFGRITGVCGRYGAGWETRWADRNTGATTGYEDRSAKFCGRGA